MPALCALGQHKALVAVSERLLPTERLFAFHDDLYVLCGAPCVADVHVALQQASWEHSRIQVHHGKTQLWNRGGEAPRGWRARTAAARQVDPDAIVWRGDPELHPSEQGVKVFGTPLGHPEYVRAFPELDQNPQAFVGADPSDPRSAGCTVGVALLRGFSGKLFAQSGSSRVCGGFRG